MAYTVKATSIETGTSYVYERIVADGIIKEGGNLIAYRYLHNDRRQYFEIPMASFIFEFSAERQDVIEDNLSKARAANNPSSENHLKVANAPSDTPSQDGMVAN